MGVVSSRFDVHLVRLDPTEGREIRKTRPCVIISPDEMNRHIGTVIVAPMTTFRSSCRSIGGRTVGHPEADASGFHADSVDP